MVLLKILGAIDVITSIVYLSMIFGLTPPTSFILFPAILIFVKGLFIFTGDFLSAVDIFASLVLLTSLFFSIPSILLWTPAFLLLAKGVVSFI